MKEPNLAVGNKSDDRNVFTEWSKATHSQSAPGWMMTHSARLCLSALQTFLFEVDTDEMLISGCDYYYSMRAFSLSLSILL